MFFAFFGLSPACLHGYFHNIQGWTNGEQVLFLFSDMHKYTANPYPQRIELIKAAKHLKAFVIAEDILSPNLAKSLDAEKTGKIDRFADAITNDCYVEIPEIGRKINPNYNPNKDYSKLLTEDFLSIANQHISPLPCLTQFCRQYEIPTKNVEFRFWSYLKDLLELNEKVRVELKSYRDNPVLDKLYQEILDDEFNANVTEILQIFISKHGYLSYSNFLEDNLLYDQKFEKLFEVASLILNNQRAQEIDFSVKKSDKKETILDVFASSFIDARILHEIYSNPQHTSIFVCAGTWHINNISKFLPQLGFKPIPCMEIGTHFDIELKSSEPKYCVINIKKYFDLFHSMQKSTSKHPRGNSVDDRRNSAEAAPQAKRAAK